MNKSQTRTPPKPYIGMHNKEFKQTLAERNKSRMWTSEAREKLRIAGIKNRNNLPSRKGAAMSPEAREKISKALKGRKKPEGHGAKVSKAMMGNKRGVNSMVGKKHSAETKQKISDSKRGEKSRIAAFKAHETKRRKRLLLNTL